MTAVAVPARDEAAEYYFKYIDQVPEGDICLQLETQLAETLPLLRSIGETQSLHRYAPDKWSIRQTLSHLNDCERLFGFRAWWFARGFDSPLPSFEQEIAVAESGADQQSWAGLIGEFESVRASTVSFYRGLPAAAWDRRGIASGNTFSVRALAFIAVGHVIHHVKILNERYLT
jgi:DinB superfamily